jgi:hypothetical protein
MNAWNPSRDLTDPRSDVWLLFQGVPGQVERHDCLFLPCGLGPYDSCGLKKRSSPLDCGSLEKVYEIKNIISQVTITIT